MLGRIVDRVEGQEDNNEHVGLPANGRTALEGSIGS